MTLDDLNARLLTTGQALADAYTSLNETAFKTAPRQGGWPPAGVVGHLHMSETGILRLLQGPGAPVERDNMAKAQLIREWMENSSRKVAAPANLEPDMARVELAGSADRLLERRRKIAEVLTSMPADEECVLYAHPAFGPMTRPEWALFVCTHGERHLQQLQDILKDQSA